MKNTILRVWGIVLTLAILSGLLMAVVPVNAGDLTWTAITVPKTASGGILTTTSVSDWVFAVAKDGKTMLAYNKGAVTTPLMKSTNAGASFSTTGVGVGLPLGIKIIKIADDSLTAIATDGTSIYASTDAGANWTLVALPGTFVGPVTAVDITAGPAILVGGNGHYAIFKSAGAFGGGWTDYTAVAPTPGLALGTVIGAAFSPNYAGDSLVVLITTSGLNTYARFAFGVRPVGEQYADQKIATDTVGVAQSAFISFPSDFASNNLLVGITGTGDLSTGLWKISMIPYTATVPAVSATARIATVSIGSLSFKGTWAAGTAYYTTANAGGVSRLTGVAALTASTAVATPSAKVTGAIAYVAASMAADNVVYALTAGAGGAFNVSNNGAASFVQTSMIYVNTAFSIDSVTYVDANTIFMITSDAVSSSIFATTDGGATWQRIQYSTTVGAYKKIFASPAYATDKTLYITTPGPTNTTVYKSTDGGATLVAFLVNAPVDDMAIIDANTFYYLGGGNAYKSSALYTPITIGNAWDIYYISAALIYVGTSDGKVYKSTDGATFAAVGATAPFGATSKVVVAADASTLYAGSDFPGERVHKYSTTTGAWTDYGAGTTTTTGGVTTTTGILSATTAVITSIALNSNGILYVADTGTPNGVWRIADGTNWENLAFPDAVKQMNLVGAVVYANSSTTDYTYNDTLGVIPVFTSPGTGPAALFDTKTAILSWAGITGATQYTYTLSMNSDMSSPTIAPTTTANTSVFLGNANLINGQTYYATVQVTAPKMSKKSAVSSFQTQLTNTGTDLTNIMAPAAGAITSTSPAFAWSSVANAKSYEFKLSDKSDFSVILDSIIGLTSTVYNSPTTLKAGTAYYWEVRAVNGTNTSAWVQSTFSTASVAPTSTATAPAQTIPTPINNITVTVPTGPAATITIPPAATPNVTVNVPPAATQAQPTYTINVPTTPMDNKTPAWAWIVIAIGAVLVIAVIVLIVRTRRV